MFSSEKIFPTNSEGYKLLSDLSKGLAAADSEYSGGTGLVIYPDLNPNEEEDTKGDELMV